jgi:MerR family copper efflux transcriptional regulator
VKALAASHLQALDRKLEELGAMRAALANLIGRCSGNARPNCPIMDELGAGEAVPAL